MAGLIRSTSPERAPSPVRGRLAPSPTGDLHAGNVCTFLLAWLSVRAAGPESRLILRIEDIDRDRCKPGAAARAVDDLRWLGLDWDEGPDVGGAFAPYLQSRRLDRYRAALERLRAAGLAYPCTCSRADLAAAASAPHGRADTGPVYPGTCRDRYPTEEAARNAAGRAPAWRFDSRRTPPVPWRDGLAPEAAAPDTVEDFVLWRADGIPSYQLAVAVDDRAMRVSEVVRGADLAFATPWQLALIAALDGDLTGAPVYRHVPLVVDENGRRLAKRADATRIATVRQMGVPPERLIGLLAHAAGLAPDGTPCRARDLVGLFDWGHVHRQPIALGAGALLALTGL